MIIYVKNVLICIFFLIVAAETSAQRITFDFKGQLSAFYTASFSSSGNHLVLRYLPDLSIDNNLSDNYLWDLNASLNIDAIDVNHKTGIASTSATIYRLNTQIKTPQSDIRFGLQQINFGPALILRSLRWFDQLSPTDVSKLTQGVTGIRYRYFFQNNSNIWLWILYGNHDTKGYELVETKKFTPEIGARMQYPLQLGEIGLSFHARKTEAMGFSATAYGQDLIEKRAAIDGKWDLGAGLWFEYVLVDQGAESRTDNNWFTMLTLGSDYTLTVGNGLHILGEHLVNGFLHKGLDWENTYHTSALQLSYPIGILDSIYLIEMVAWTNKRRFHFLRWDRNYDNWSFNFGLFSASNHNYEVNTLGAGGYAGNGIQAGIVYNH